MPPLSAQHSVLQLLFKSLAEDIQLKNACLWCKLVQTAAVPYTRACARLSPQVARSATRRSVTFWTFGTYMQLLQVNQRYPRLKSRADDGFKARKGGHISAPCAALKFLHSLRGEWG